MRLRGTYHPLAYLLEQIPVFLPGVTDISGIWRDYKGNLIYYNSGNYLQLSTENEAHIQFLRSKKFTNYWLDENDLMQIRSGELKQRSLDDEQNLRTLLLNFDSVTDNFKDILVITFPAQYTIHSLNQTFSSLSTSEKSLLSNLLSNIFNAEYKRVIKERILLEHIEFTVDKQTQEISQLEDKLQLTEQLYIKSIKVLADDIANELGIELEHDFELTHDFIVKLATAHLNHKSLKKVIINAINVSYSLNFSKSTIVVNEQYLQIKREENKGNYSNNETDKVTLLLDRYEQSSEYCLKLKLNVNGKNIAAHLDPPVTPPAITDAVKKNQRRIAFLFEKFPERWTNIRRNLRPLSQIDDNRNSATSKMAS